MLILLRHGRTRLNATGRLQGRIDEPLDDVGRTQAEASATYLGDFDELISSPLARARQTADAFGRPYVVDERWVELAYGVYDGAAAGDVPSEAWRNWKADPHWRPDGGGESFVALEERVWAACAELLERAGERNIVVVSHVSPIKAAVAWALGVGSAMAWRSHLAQPSVCRIARGHDGPVVHSFSEPVPPLAVPEHTAPSGRLTR